LRGTIRCENPGTIHQGWTPCNANDTYTYYLGLTDPIMPAPRSIKKSRGTPVDSPERRRLPILLRHAWYGLNQAFRRRIAHLGMTPDQFTVMRTLLEGTAEGLVQNELAERMASDPNTIAALLRRMAKAGLVERKAHETDRRANRICLTPGGFEKYQRARELALELQTRVLAELPADRRETFLSDLNLVAMACREACHGSK
jgi:DNA-binding MarR family transcriptional regulator